MDTRAARTASSIDPQMATVGAINRPTNCRRQDTHRAKRVWGGQWL